MKGDYDCMICGAKFKMTKSFAKHYLEKHVKNSECWCGYHLLNEGYFQPDEQRPSKEWQLTDHLHDEGGPRKHYLECLMGVED